MPWCACTEVCSARSSLQFGQTSEVSYKLSRCASIPQCKHNGAFALYACRVVVRASPISLATARLNSGVDTSRLAACPPCERRRGRRVRACPGTSSFVMRERPTHRVVGLQLQVLCPLLTSGGSLCERGGEPTVLRWRGKPILPWRGEKCRALDARHLN